MKKIDCFGDICPLPILRADKMLESIEKGESFMLVTDHSCVIQSIRERYKNSGVTLSVTEVLNGVWEIVFTKE